MRFVYKYRTSDNVEHDGEVTAVDREAAYRAIRAQGRKPGQLKEADGFFNHLLGKGKRWMAIVVLSVGVVVALCLWLRTEREKAVVVRNEAVALRHQIYGDPEIMRAMSDAGFSNCLERVGDRILAQFAQPGTFVSARGYTADDLSAALAAVAERDLAIDPDEGREIRELKQIVNGMRVEMREYLSDGMGSYRSYFNRLVERYMAEKQIHDRVVAELAKEKDAAVWSKKNEELRRMGLAVVVKSEE